MAISVYGWRKPTLTLELVEGGSLLPNTTYYVAGVFKWTPVTYTSCGSVVSDIYSIVTTSTAKSIRITHKTYRDITNFASGGAGITTCTSTLHCVKTGDVIKIATGSYAGTWTVTKVNPNTFTIPTAYVDNVPVQCYTDSQYYNRPSEISGYSDNVHHVSYYVHTINPFSNGVDWIQYANWTSASYQTNNRDNPTVITSAPAQNFSIGNPCLKVRRLNRGFLNSVAEYGTIAVIITASHTLEQIYNAIKAEGFVYNCMFDASMDYFWLVGSLLGTGAGAISSTGINFCIINGEFLNVTNPQNFVLTKCTLDSLPKTNQNTFKALATDCIYINNSPSVSNLGWFMGDRNIIQGSPYPLNSTYACDIPNQTLFNYGDGQNKSYGIVQNKIWRPMNSSSVIQDAYNQIQFKNCTLFTLYYLMYNGAYGTQPNIYMLENCYLTQAGHPDYTANHFRFYAYAAGQPYQNIIKYLNLNTDDANNVKKCCHNSIINIDALFYRRCKFYIKDQQGNPLQSVSISIIDGSDNEYSGSTDVNGYAYVDCLEQKTSFTTSIPLTYLHNPQYDTFYTNFTITISKAGYDDEIIPLISLYQTGNYDTILNLTLHSEPKISGVVIIDCSAIGRSDGSIQVTAESGTEPYQYSMNGTDWQSGNIFSDLSIGNYTVYVKDANDNTDSLENITIGEPVEEIHYRETPVIVKQPDAFNVTTP